MRWLMTILAATCLGVAGVAIYSGAARIDGGVSERAGAQSAPEDVVAARPSAAVQEQRRPQPAASPPQTERKARPSSADKPQPATEGKPTEKPDDVLNTIRSVAPDIIASPDIDPNMLQRLEPRGALSRIGRAGPPKRSVRPEGPDVFQPVAVAAGRIETDEVTITIAGIEPVEPEAQCSRAEGGQWPCGMAARTALRSLLRGRALDCDLPEGERGEALTASCSLGATDLGAWLVENGWARATAGGPYAELEDAARHAGRGVFGAGPKPLPEFGQPRPTVLETGQPATRPSPSAPLGNGLY